MSKRALKYLNEVHILTWKPLAKLLVKIEWFLLSLIIASCKPCRCSGLTHDDIWSSHSHLVFFKVSFNQHVPFCRLQIVFSASEKSDLRRKSLCQHCMRYSECHRRLILVTSSLDDSLYAILVNYYIQAFQCFDSAWFDALLINIWHFKIAHFFCKLASYPDRLIWQSG